MRKPAERRLRVVTTNLFDDNVEELKDRAAKDRTSWQADLRLLVDEALKARKRRRVT